MIKTGQVTLVLISVLFTAHQWYLHDDPFFTVDFFIFTFIAWLVGWQYDRMRALEKKARASEESYKTLIDSLPESVIIHRDFQIVFVNKAAVAMIGSKCKDELIGKPIFHFADSEYEARMRARIEQAKKLRGPLSNIEHKLRRVDGSKFFFEASSLSIMFGGREAILTIGKDITERKEQTERLLQKSEKLGLLGQMAAGIAHEIRNPLTSIKGFIQLFKSNSLKKEYYDIVLGELERINEIVGEFLILAKPSAAVFIDQDIKDLIKDVVTLINTQSILSNVQIFAEFENDLPIVSCEANQFKQVILNLLKNAIEAMPNGGNIEVRVSKKGEGELSVQIIDQGIGIPEERIATLGEPFYTTKEKGTGLGLMTCFKIIESHNGKLDIYSKLNEGTTVEITLPTIRQPFLVK